METWRFTSSDVLFHALPIFHTHGLFVASNVTFLAGSSMIFMPSFKVQQAIEHLPRATTMMGVPTFYTRCWTILDSIVTWCNMRLFISRSALYWRKRTWPFEERTGHRILGALRHDRDQHDTSNPYKGERRAGTPWATLPGIGSQNYQSGNSNACPTGEIGMIEVRGPNVFTGYWNMPENCRGAQ